MSEIVISGRSRPKGSKNKTTHLPTDSAKEKAREIMGITDIDREIRETKEKFVLLERQREEAASNAVIDDLCERFLNEMRAHGIEQREAVKRLQAVKQPILGVDY